MFVVIPNMANGVIKVFPEKMVISTLQTKGLNILWIHPGLKKNTRDWYTQGSKTL